MKPFYSSTFLSAILGFLILLGKTEVPIVMTEDLSTPSFQTIIEPAGPTIIPKGSPKVTLEVFSAFGCQNCNLFGQGTLPQLVEKYDENDKVDFRFYLIPDTEDELYATRGVHCAFRHGELFWEMIDELHKAETLNKREVDLIGQGLNLPILEFRSCLNSDEFDHEINLDVDYAQERKIPQKPTIFVNGTMLLGPQPIENIDYIIRKRLNQSTIPNDQ